MASDNLLYTRISLAGGINTNTDLASPGQVLSGKNVWAPRGHCVRRPGYLTWAFNLFPIPVADGSPVATETPAGAVTLQLGGALALSVDSLSKWYVKVADPTVTFGILVLVIANNANNVVRRFEYWNGTDWVYLPSIHGAGGAFYLSTSVSEMFIPPPDWSQVTIGGNTGYWLRSTLLGAITAGTTITTVGSGYVTRVPGEIDNVRVAEFPFGTYLAIAGSAEPDANITVFAATSTIPPTFPVASTPVSVSRMYQEGMCSFAVLPTFNEIYGAGPYNTIRYTYDGSAWSITEALVEDAESLVGQRGIYATIAKLPGFPRGEFIEYFNDRLWIVSGDGNVHWSMGGLGYRVFAALATTKITEDDDSPVTGIAGLGEQLVIFKRESIWIMVDAGIDAFGITQFVATKVVSGTGCVSHKTIQKIRGSLVFLARDGVYRFDGTPNVVKVSIGPSREDRLADIWSRITPGRSRRAAACDWSENGCYLLSVPLDGSGTNNHVIVWDYERDAFWLWDSINADTLFVIRSGTDQGMVHFTSQGPSISKLHGCGEDYYSPVNSEILSHPVGYRDPSRKIMRRVEVMGSSRMGTVNVDIDTDDEAAIQSGSMSFDIGYDDGRNLQRTRHVKTRVLGANFRVRLSKATSFIEEFDVKYIDVGHLPHGRR